MGERDVRYVAGNGELPRYQRDLDQLKEQRQTFLRMAERMTGAITYVDAQMRRLEDELSADAKKDQSAVSGEGAES